MAMVKALEEVDFEGMKVEMIGVFAVVYMGGWSFNNFSLGQSDYLSVATTHLFAYALFIWAGYRISGGHLNPALTVSLIFSKRVRFFKGLFYIASQLIGSLLAVSLLKLISGEKSLTEKKNESNLFGHSVPTNILVSALYDFIGTFLVVIVYYTVALGSNNKNYHLHGIAVGSAYFTNMLVSGRQGASGNIARFFGPFCLGEQWMSLLLLSIGSMAGALLASLISEQIILKDLNLNPVNPEEILVEQPKDRPSMSIYIDENSQEVENDEVQMHL